MSKNQLNKCPRYETISSVRDAVFHPAALKVIREFPEEVRRGLGKAVWDLQMGFTLSMPLSRSLRSVGKGVEELRFKDRGGIYRVFYIARFEERILSFMLLRGRRRRRLSLRLRPERRD